MEVTKPRIDKERIGPEEVVVDHIAASGERGVDPIGAILVTNIVAHRGRVGIPYIDTGELGLIDRIINNRPVPQ